MSTCRDAIRDLFPDFINANLDPEMEAKVTNHLAACPECDTEVRVLRQLGDEFLPEPAPWFFTSLPGKVTARIEDRRKRKARMLIPAWAGGLALAAIAAVMFLLPGADSQIPTQIPNYSAAQDGASLHLGLEEEILEVSNDFVDDIDRTIAEDLDTVSGDVFVSMNAIFENDVYEIMDEQTIRIFESLVEEMIPENVGKKVMS